MNRHERRLAAKRQKKASAGVQHGAMPSDPVVSSLNAAVAFHQAGELERAEAIYRDVLTRAPSNPDALHLLGVVLTQRGQPADAIPLLRRAITSGGERPAFLSSLGIAHRGLAEHDASIAAYRRAIAADPDHAESWINLGNSLAESGATGEAADAYEQGLARKPDSANGWTALGSARLTLGDTEGAIRAFDRALSIDPDHVDALRRLADHWLDRGRIDEAIETYRDACAIAPQIAMLHDRLGVALQMASRTGPALASHRRAVEIDPDDGDAQANLGAALLTAGRPEEAVPILHRALSLAPHSVEAHAGLGRAYRALGDINSALRIYRRACEIAAEDPRSHNNLAVALTELDRADEAATAYARALDLDPAFAEAHNNLGNLLRKTGRSEDAIARYRSAIRLAPDYAAAHFNLGCALLGAGRAAEAVHALDDAVSLDPGRADAHLNLGTCLQSLGRLAEAAAAYDQALALDSGFARARNNLGIVRLMQGRVEEAEVCFEGAMRLNEAVQEVPPAGMHSNRLFAMNYNPYHDAESIYLAHREWERRHAPRGPARPRHRNPAAPDRPLRIGYLSPDFRQHAVAFFFLPLLANHDAAGFETHCYAELSAEDDVSRRIAASARGWRRTDGESDESVARMIEEDGIDILVDLAGHTKGNRLPVLARKPAPVQISYLGYPTTTGMATVDYKLSDAHLTPPSTPERFAERVLNLPDSFLCYAPPLDAPAVMPAPLGRPVTFGSFNATAKIGEPVVALWSRLLVALPDAKLILKTQALGDPATRDRYLAMFSTQGVAPAQIDLRGHDDTIGEHLAQYGEIDIALDPFPYNGGTTTLEALWMGVPVLTLAGDRSSARHGLSILATAGLSDLVSRTPEAFLRTARSLAWDVERRAGLRAGLRERIAGAPLCDGRRFAANVETLYRTAWRNWCAESLRIREAEAITPPEDRS